MRLNMGLRAAAVSLLVLCAACGTEESAQTGLTLSESSPRQLQGRFAEEGVALTFDARSDAPERMTLALQVNGRPFDYRVDHQAAEAHYDGHGAVLTASERAALLRLSEGLLERVPASYVRDTFAAVVGYWSESPEGYAHEPHVAKLRSADVSATSLVSDGITCLTRGTYARAFYDRGNGGTSYFEDILVGANWGYNSTNKSDYNCMGRCGASCTGASVYPNRYTLDCLEHDACSYRFSASGGSSDTNCGDEFREAADDFDSYVVGGRCNN